jgi:hypothetical protein
MKWKKYYKKKKTPLKLLNVVKFEVIGAMTVFWYMMPCSLVWIRDRLILGLGENQQEWEQYKEWKVLFSGKWHCVLPLRVNRHFGGTCHHHVCGWKISQARNQHKGELALKTCSSKMSVDFQRTTQRYTWGRRFHSQCCENLEEIMVLCEQTGCRGKEKQ